MAEALDFSPSVSRVRRRSAASHRADEEETTTDRGKDIVTKIGNVLVPELGHPKRWKHTEDPGTEEIGDDLIGKSCSTLKPEVEPGIRVSARGTRAVRRRVYELPGPKCKNSSGNGSRGDVSARDRCASLVIRCFDRLLETRECLRACFSLHARGCVHKSPLESANE